MRLEASARYLAMRIALTGLSSLVLVAATLAGCTVESTSSPSNGSSSSGGGVTDNDAGSTPVPASLPFKASNVKLDGVDASKLGDVVIAQASCSIDTESKLIGCIDNDLVQYVVVDQPGAGKIGVYVAKSVRIEPNAGLRTKGTYALAIVALDSLDVQGTIDASAESDYASAGGFRVPNGGNVRGGGDGGGGAREPVARSRGGDELSVGTAGHVLDGGVEGKGQPGI